MNQIENQFPEELTPHQQAAILSFKSKFDLMEAEREYGELLQNAASLMPLEQLVRELRELDDPSNSSQPRPQ